jgi:hypothetical protein
MSYSIGGEGNQLGSLYEPQLVQEGPVGKTLACEIGLVGGNLWQGKAYYM